MPIAAVKDNNAKTLMAKAAPNQGVSKYAVEVASRFAEQLGYNKVILKSDSEPAILALKEAVRREERGDCYGGGSCGISSSRWRRGECGEERAGSIQGAEEHAGEQDQ